MHMRKLAYTARADSATRKTGVGSNEVTAKVNTADFQVEVNMFADGKTTVTFTSIEVTGPFATREITLLRRYIINADGTLDYEYVDDIVAEEEERLNNVP